MRGLFSSRAGEKSRHQKSSQQAPQGLAAGPLLKSDAMSDLKKDSKRQSAQGARASVDDLGDEDDERHVRWDEETIAEHDKLRGTRQKIDEPDTPFHRDSFIEDSEEGELEDGYDDDVKVVFADGVGGSRRASKPKKAPKVALDADELSSMLGKAAEEEEVPTAAKKAAHDDFVAKRKQHYNEFEALRKWRESHTDDEEEDDE